LARERQIKLPRYPLIAERMGDADGAHRIPRQEDLNVPLGRQWGRRNLEPRRPGVERLAAELPVEILRVLGRAMEVDQGRAAIAERKRGAAKPIFAERYALGAGGGAPQRQEVAKSGRRIRQEAERDPAGEKFRLDISVAGYEAMLGGNL